MLRYYTALFPSQKPNKERNQPSIPFPGFEEEEYSTTMSGCQDHSFNKPKP